MSGNADTVTDSEDRILHWVWCIVEEAFTVVDFDEDDVQAPTERDPTSLGLAVIMIWSHFFKSNTQWPFINIIGKSLYEYYVLLTQGKEVSSRDTSSMASR